jgi:nitric oxide reductase activation protein
MKMTWCAMFVCLSSNAALADSVLSRSLNRLHLADATADACLASCSSQNASCKRVCPATFSTPCLSSCDSQAQACRQSCQSK